MARSRNTYGTAKRLIGNWSRKEETLVAEILSLVRKGRSIDHQDA